MPAFDSPLSVYVHIPFCLRACPYCNFNFRLMRNYDDEFRQAYVEAIVQEWHLWCKTFKTPPNVTTLYFGGGTPSLLNPEQISFMIRSIGGSNPKLEITLEANPEDLAEKEVSLLKAYQNAGVNRLSLGAQSMNATTLAALGRMHTPQNVTQVMTSSRQVGFQNISCDVMGGAPRQNLEMLKSDLSEIMALAPEHISYYGLTVEEKTLFYVLVRKNRLAIPREEVQAEMFVTVQETLTRAGYLQYEISNYAKSGFESQHNTGYWAYREYVGLGAGAHSFFHQQGVHRRLINEKNPARYVKTLTTGQFAHDVTEEISGERAMGEFVFTGLRMRKGISLHQLRENFSQDLCHLFEKKLANLLQGQLIEWVKSGSDIRLRLTKTGVLFSDTVFEAFV